MIDYEYERNIRLMNVWVPRLLSQDAISHIVIHTEPKKKVIKRKVKSEHKN